MPEEILSIIHETRYRYERPVERSRHLLRLRPVDDARQRVLDYTLCLSGGAIDQEFEDVFGNQVATAKIDTPFSELRIISRSRVALVPPAPLGRPPGRLRVPPALLPRERQMLLPYLLPPELPDDELRELSAYATGFAERNDWDLLDTLSDLNATIHREYAYQPGATTVDTTAYQTWCSRRGVCQDFTTLFLCLVRLLGVPARYRMGYLRFQGHGADESERATHAWAEVYGWGFGWRGFDPTHGGPADAGYVRVACGRTARDATPTSGTLFGGGGREILEARVQVTEIAGD